MKNKLKLLVCYLLICAFVPINLTFADNLVDRDNDGIHIDDIVYYLSQTGSLSNSDIRRLLDQIVPIIPLPTAQEVAAGITSVTIPAADATSLTLPSVPSGYTIAINTSSNIGVVGTNNAIVPPAVATSVDLVFTVTRTSDNTTANTGTITVVVPAHVSTAGEIAAGITSVTTPAADETGLTLPAVPTGYTIGTYSSSNTGVIGTNGAIAPPVASTSVDLVFTVTRTSDNTTANTGTITVVVPAHVSTAGEIAAGITSVTTPAADETGFTLPAVPTGYTIGIYSSSNTGVIGTNGAIAPPAAATSVDLVFAVTRTSDNTTANTGTITVLIPAYELVKASGENAPWEGKEKAFDGDTSTKWFNPYSSTGWIQYQLTAAHIITQYSLTSANDVPSRDPKDWTLMGSNNGTDWTTLDTRVGQTFAGRLTTNTYTYSNSTSYFYYRLNVTANWGDSGLQLSEIGLFGTPAPVVIDISNNATNGNSFGSTVNEVKRFQTFTANNNPNLTSVDVKIHKRIDGAQTDVTIQLFATSGGIPSGSPLASTTISSSLVGTSYSEIKVPLTCNGMINGTKYAIVLGQTTNDDGNNYEWLSGQSGITGENYGKFDGVSTWTDESFLGNGWLKVYVN